jgi:hypothetical protein
MALVRENPQQIAVFLCTCYNAAQDGPSFIAVYFLLFGYGGFFSFLPRSIEFRANHTVC